MGYYTFHDLSYDAPEGSETDDRIQAWIDNDQLREEFENLYPGGACGMTKTLDPDPDMLRLSQAFPEVLFTLHGSGEEDTDLWYTYYRDGRLQHADAQIHYPPFDPKLLREPAEQTGAD